MENNNKIFYIVYYASKHKKHITRKGKHDEKIEIWNI